jgi:predicted XRE-type DNA-binding protein
MISYLFDIGERARKVGRFTASVREGLQNAVFIEKRRRKLTQQQIATSIGVNRSVINRQIMGTENLTISRVAELAWAIGWDVEVIFRDPLSKQESNVISGTNVIEHFAVRKQPDPSTNVTGPSMAAA